MALKHDYSSENMVIQGKHGKWIQNGSKHISKHVPNISSIWTTVIMIINTNIIRDNILIWNIFTSPDRKKERKVHANKDTFWKEEQEIVDFLNGC